MDTLNELVDRLKAGDDEAARDLWERYFPDVVQLAGRRLGNQGGGVADEEDVGISVMESFFRAARAGRFPDLDGHDQIWKLLAAMTCRKVVDRIRRSVARPAQGESGLGEQGINALPAGDPTPVVLATVQDEFKRLVEALPENCRAIALRKLECKTIAEIAEDCDVHPATVERRLRIIRETWRRLAAETDAE